MVACLRRNLIRALSARSTFFQVKLPRGSQHIRNSESVGCGFCPDPLKRTKKHCFFVLGNTHESTCHQIPAILRLPHEDTMPSPKVLINAGNGGLFNVLRFLKWKRNGKWKMENGKRIHHPCVLLGSRGEVAKRPFRVASVQVGLSNAFQKPTSGDQCPRSSFCRSELYPRIRFCRLISKNGLQAFLNGQLPDFLSHGFAYYG